MQIPVWLVVIVAALVLAYGGVRLRIFLIPKADYAQMGDRGPWYRVPRRMHLMMSGVCFVFGIWILLTAFGVSII